MIRTHVAPEKKACRAMLTPSCLYLAPELIELLHSINLNLHHMMLAVAYLSVCNTRDRVAGAENTLCLVLGLGGSKGHVKMATLTSFSSLGI